jgi:hypothetical protein
MAAPVASPALGACGAASGPAATTADVSVLAARFPAVTGHQSITIAGIL